MTKCSANGGYHVPQEKEAFGLSEGQNTPQTLQPQNGTLLHRMDQTLHRQSRQLSPSDTGTVWEVGKSSTSGKAGGLRM